MKILSIFLALVWLNSPQWSTDFEKAITEAQQQNKYIVLNFSGSDWCGPCIKLKQNVLDSHEFLTFSEKRLILVRADFPRQKKNQLSVKQSTMNENLAEKYNQEGKFPLILLIDAYGKVLKSWDGYPSSLTIQTLTNDISMIVNARK